MRPRRSEANSELFEMLNSLQPSLLTRGWAQAKWARQAWSTWRRVPQSAGRKQETAAVAAAAAAGQWQNTEASVSLHFVFRKVSWQLANEKMLKLSHETMLTRCCKCGIWMCSFFFVTSLLFFCLLINNPTTDVAPSPSPNKCVKNADTEDVNRWRMLVFTDAVWRNEECH